MKEMNNKDNCKHKIAGIFSYLLMRVIFLVIVVVAVMVSISMIVIIAGNSNKQDIYSPTDLVAAIVGLATVVFNISKINDAGKNQNDPDILRIFILFTAASVFFTLFLLIYPCYANMTDPNAAHSIPMLMVAISLVLASLLLVIGIFYLIRFMLRKWPGG